MQDNIVTMTWPGAFERDDSPRTSVAGNPLRDYFISDGDRYAFDFGHCGLRSDWYQFDGDQDACYYGTWVNPVLRQVICYCEGDISLIECDTREAYIAEVRALYDFLARRGCAYDRYGIDDHDERHDEKMNARKAETATGPETVWCEQCGEAPATGFSGHAVLCEGCKKGGRHDS